MQLTEDLIDLLETALEKEWEGHARPGAAPGEPAPGADATPPAGSASASAPLLLSAAGPVVLVSRDSTVAWVLAAYPADADPVLVASARSRAEAAAPAAPSRDAEVGFLPDDHESDPAPPPAVLTTILELGDQQALAWFTHEPLPGRQRAALTSRAADLAPSLRAALPGSRSLAVAGLEPAARVLFERAARIASEQVVDHVRVRHLAAALLAEDQLTPPLEGLCPEPEAAALALLTAVGDGEDARRRLRARIIEALRGPSHDGADEAGPGTGAADPDDQIGRFAVLRGVRVLTSVRPVDTEDPDDAATAADPTTRPADPREAAIHAAALDVAVHLARSDVPAVVLAGLRPDRLAVLEQLARLMRRGRIPALVGRDLVHVDPSAVPEGHDHQLGDLVARQAEAVAIALDHPAQRLALRLAAAARAGGAPAILLTVPEDPIATDPALTDAPVVRVDAAGVRPRDVASELAATAVQIAAAHGVRLTPGVAAAAAAPAPESRRRRKPSIEDFLRDHELDPDPIDPISLGRARLEYACARAALRPDRAVRPDDVPTDPRQGPESGRSSARVPYDGAALSEQLADRIVGQAHVVSALAERLRYAARGLRRTGPRAALLLAGPPGTGKTHTASAVAEVFYGDPDALIRIDCGALYERHTVTALLGAPPSYVGHDETSGLLTTRINDRRGQVVVLFDEIEKAHPRVLDVLLSVLDSGSLVDFANRVADATPSIFLLTNNLGSEAFARQATGFAAATQGRHEADVRSAVRDHLRPELLDRLDGVLIYRPLGRPALEELTDRHLRQLTELLAADGYDLQVSASVGSQLAGRVEARGVRGLRRYLESALLRDLLAHPPGRYRARLGPDGIEWEAANASAEPGRSADDVATQLIDLTDDRALRPSGG